MTTQIDTKIVSFKVLSDQSGAEPDLQPSIEQMHEQLARPEMLTGTTYKLKTPSHVSEHSLFITINDIVLNPGTDHESRRPFEIFINCKSMEHFQWIVALTRIMSAVFRKGGDCTFIVEELRSVFDPKGGYWNHGRYVGSLIAEIGDVIEQHLIKIGLIPPSEPDPHQQAFLDSKREELANQMPQQGAFPASAQLCKKCQHKAAIFKDGCLTCLNCGDSKCG
ncbi:TSCPD domain-containing protein [Bowmanella dokdonensis]|uniref:ribonucleoside-diphosphate reductase n=1 Tax=Bowmanella dokdonensis TaxID=751969 RepID=A0A939DKI7_9ALTE|nr:NrdJb [Bowmanella dokdonensis]MBN7824332.1 NrdJb [Bowmanella dokdonensis]